MISLEKRSESSVCYANKARTAPCNGQLQKICVGAHCLGKSYYKRLLQRHVESEYPHNSNKTT